MITWRPECSLASLHHDVKGKTSTVSRRAATLYIYFMHAHTYARLGLSKACRARTGAAPHHLGAST